MDRTQVSFAKIFKAYPHLTELTITHMALGSQNYAHRRIGSLASILAKNPPLKKLSLLYCDVNNTGATYLANALKSNSILSVLAIEM